MDGEVRLLIYDFSVYDFSLVVFFHVLSSFSAIYPSDTRHFQSFERREDQRRHHCTANRGSGGLNDRR